MSIARVLAACSALSLIALLPAVAAQDDCTQQSSPCPAVISVDDHGFTEISQPFFTQNEWYVITFSNEDYNATHTIALDQYQSVTLQASTDQDVTLQMTKAGCFNLHDSVTGATRQIGVVSGDSVSVSPDQDPCHGTAGQPSSGASSSSKAKVPGFELVALVAAIGLALVAARIRRE